MVDIQNTLTLAADTQNTLALMADLKTMLALGEFRFSVNSAAYQSLQRSVEYRWPAQERLGRSPARQFAGKGNESLSLEGVIFPFFRPQYEPAISGQTGNKPKGLGQVDKMRDEAGKGMPLTLTDGHGNVLGKWCIEQIEETRTVFFDDGTPRKIEFNLTLAYYGEDR